MAELTSMLDANYLIIWGDHEEKTIAEEVKALSPQVNICDKLTLQALISLILKVDLVIGPDTGPTHMAWAWTGLRQHFSLPDVKSFSLRRLMKASNFGDCCQT